MQSSPNRSGLWTINPVLGLLCDGNGEEVRLEPRLSKLMTVLLGHAGEYVSRRELMDQIWPDVMVTEQSLTRAVADLRKFLRTTYSDPPLIETASKQGYRLSFPSEDTRSSPIGHWNAIKMIGYTAGLLILFILVLRGLSY